MSFTFRASEAQDFTGQGLSFKCSIGKGGMVNASDKREGDGASPIGRWEMKRVFFRNDRVSAPETSLPIVPISETDGWCDDPADPLYNRPVTLPYSARHEKLWREDHVYDIIVELGHNDNPPVPGLGSAIFLHISKGDYEPTEGCIALKERDLRAVLNIAEPGTMLEIRGKD